jgi:hypothetical protein
MHVTAEAVWVGRARLQGADVRVVGQAVTMLRCALVGADGGGWIAMVEAVCMRMWAPC